MKRNAHLNYNTLPMENAFNVRELGGYAARKGSVTKYHEFLRTENLTEITEGDQEFLLHYGLKAAIDLRGREETLIYPNPFRDHPEVKYINLPFITESVLDMRQVKEKGFRPEEFYINLVTAVFCFTARPEKTEPGFWPCSCWDYAEYPKRIFWQIIRFLIPI